MDEIIIALIGSGVLSALISGAVTLATKMMDKKSNNNRLMLSITRDRIKHICRQRISEGSISFDEYEDLVEMHSAYHAAGGNGYCDDLMNRVKQLPMK